jgi:hypothetical protein
MWAWLISRAIGTRTPDHNGSQYRFPPRDLELGKRLLAMKVAKRSAEERNDWEEKLLT